MDEYINVKRLICIVKCDVCGSDVQVIGYVKCHKDTDIEIKTLKDFHSFKQVCRHCGFGRLQATPSMAVTGAINSQDYIANRFMYTDKLIKYIRTPEWMGDGITSVISEWDTFDNKIQSANENVET